MPQDRFSLSADESTLTIFNVQPEDQGQFKCEAENIPGDWDISYFLEVTSSPNILLGSSSRAKEQVRQGSDIRLRCIATGSPEPTYQWLKDDTPVASSVKPITTTHEVDKHTVEITTISSKYVLLDQGRELVVSKVTDQDAGVYTCVAINPVGRDRHTMNLTVLASPVFHDGLDHETPELVKHKPAFLWCNATGHPPPKYKWSGDIISDQSNERIRSVASGRGLYLPNVTQDLVSRYICNAINEAGEARRVFDPTLICKLILRAKRGEE
ncbi:unnamed protein product [Dibothriocephalus latus]|uniref:Ig-like domain-containing protein n=1 Tax=Dibothriocephalus latus TaxID=60516 RepID=A0A3P7LJ12_DIBLA|nr:unnamed protein product [Dibothriocephalus latus]